MTTWSKDVYSSNVQTVAYDADTSDLYVTWAKGRTSVYSGVPAELADQVANAASVGSMLNAEIKPYYPHRYA